MENLTKELPFELAHFQVEELENRLENKWGDGNGDCEPFIEVTNEPPTGPTVNCGVRFNF